MAVTEQREIRPIREIDERVSGWRPSRVPGFGDGTLSRLALRVSD